MTAPPHAFSLLVKPNSDRCSLNCTYCFYKGTGEHAINNDLPGMMTSAEVTALVKGYRAVSAVESYVWQGGEPTDCPTQLFEFAVAAQGPHAMNSLQTNGLKFARRIPLEWLHLLKGKGNWVVGLSHDGPTNACRGVPTELLDAAALNLLAAGIPFSIMCVVSKENVDKPKEVIEHFYREEFGDAPIQFIAAKEHGTSGLGFAITGAEFTAFLGCALVATPDQGKRLNNFTAFRDAWRGRPTTCENLNQCGTYLMVDDGSVYPCDHFHHESHLLAYVDVFSRSNPHQWERELRRAWGNDHRTKWLKLKTNVHPRCEPCPVRAACARGCPADYDDTGLSVLCDAHKAVAYVTHPARVVRE